jgi:DNA-binding transcriptional ArsR family regulator
MALQDIFKALANPRRRRVFQVICRGSARDGHGLTVEQICRRTAFKQPAVSHHIAHLAGAGLITRRRERYWVHCAPERRGLDPLRRFVQNPAIG